MATIRPATLRTVRCLATIAAFAALSPSAARATPPDAVQFQVTATIPEGAALVNVNLPTVPTGKRLVIQTISYVRNFAASETIGQMALTTTVNGSAASYWAPEVYNDGAPYPSSTAAVTIYADPGTTPSISFFRGGSDSTFEACAASVSGYYAAVK